MQTGWTDKETDMMRLCH